MTRGYILSAGDRREMAITKGPHRADHGQDATRSINPWTSTQTVDHTSVWPRLEPEPGEYLGRYRIDKERGAGAMGVVYEAYDEPLQRHVAIKILRPSRAARPKERTRIIREARAMATTSHPGVVPVYDVGEHEGMLYLVMALIDAPDLAEWIRSDRSLAARLVVLQTAGYGLAAAHRAGIVHRDIKPSNVLVTSNGEGQVADFGLAIGGPDTLTSAGAHIAGTPAYMAPEQHLGHEVDARADQYSFCAMAWEVLVGDRPFRQPGLRALLAAKQAGPPPISAAYGIPKKLARALVRGLAPDPRDRWPDLESMLATMSRPAWHPPAWTTVFGVGLLGAALLGGSTPDRCEPGLAILREAWSASAKSQVESAVRAQAGDVIARSVVREADERAEQWSDAYAAACHRAPATAELVDPTRRCLARVRREMVAWIDVAQRSPAKAATALASVAPHSACEQLGEDALDLADPQAYEAVETLLSQGWSALVEGDYPHAQALLTEALRQARQAGHRTQAIEALRRLSSAQSAVGEWAQALETLEDARHEAEELGADQYLAEVWVELVFVNLSLGRIDDAELAHRSAQTALARIGGNAELEVALLINVAGLREAQGRDDEGVAALEEAATRWSQQTTRPRQRDLSLATIESNLASFAMKRGDLAEAIELTTTARERLLVRVGGRHPDASDLDVQLAFIYDMAGDTVSSRKHATRAQQALRAEPQIRYAQLIRAELVLVYAEFADGKIAEAAARLEVIANLRIEAFGSNDQEAWSYRAELARLRYDLGQVSEAQRLARQAKAAIGAADPPTEYSFTAVATAGHIAAVTGQREEGIRDLERAVALAPQVFDAEDHRRVAVLEQLAAIFEEIGMPERAATLRSGPAPDQSSATRSSTSVEIE